MKNYYSSKDQRTVEQLLIALKSENWAERRDAARELGDREDHSAVEPLIQTLNDLDLQVCSQAILSLGILGDKKAIEPLVEMFRNPNYAYHSARALSWIKSRKVVKPLIAGLKSDNEVIRRSAAEVLGHIKDKRAAEPLIEALNDVDVWVREWSVRSLGILRDRRAVTPLLTATKSKYKPVQKNDSYNKFKHQEVQSAAIIALGNIGDNSVIEHILIFLASRKRGLVLAAMQALGQLRAKKAVEPLLKKLENSKTREWAGHIAVVALGKIGDKRAFEPLVTALSDNDVVTRIAAAYGLGFLGDSRALPALRLARRNDKGIDEFGESVRAQANWAIHRIQRLEKKAF